MTADRNSSDRSGSTRRQFLVGGAVAGVGAAAAIGIDLALTSAPDAPAPAASGSTPQEGTEIVPFYGAHQAGIDTAAQTYGTFVALDLLPEVQREAQRRMMKVLTDDAARLTRGEPALADSEPELAVASARLTVTFGFGPESVARAGGSGPSWLKPLPAFSIDRLEPAYTGGDLLIQIAADDPLVVAHATRMLLKDSRSFTTVRWVQQGFRRSAGAYPERSMRNLFGQVDGTVNPVAEIVAEAKEHGVVTVVDGAQSVPHGPVDLRAIGCDFFAFSGHKVFGPMGIGVLYGKADRLAAMPPYQGGGDMIDCVTFQKTTFLIEDSPVDCAIVRLGPVTRLLGCTAFGSITIDLKSTLAFEDNSNHIPIGLAKQAHYIPPPFRAASGDLSADYPKTVVRFVLPLS